MNLGYADRLIVLFVIGQIHRIASLNTDLFGPVSGYQGLAEQAIMAAHGSEWDERYAGTGEMETTDAGVGAG